MNKFIKLVLTVTLILTLLLPSAITIFAAEDDGNDYPIILVHGNGGWGRDEKSGFLYWGGNIDIQEELKSVGYEVYTGVVGPFSSNWDRACELYAYIIGGTVDYGKAHSEEFGHARYGRTYPGLYPNWGTEDTNGINKIHILSHSQGGQTARLFAQLLEEGKQSEMTAVLGLNPSQEQINTAITNGTLSKLFTGTCNNWVESVTSFASPHDGTTMANSVNLSGNLLGLFATPAGGLLMDTVTGLNSQENYSFDLKLDQWGLTKLPNESCYNFFIRALGSEMWEGTQDFSNYDLSTQGATKMNQWVEDQPNIYYFSYSCQATKKGWLTDLHFPDSNYMNPLFNANSLIMGSYQNYFENVLGSKWFPNDGYVNTISEDGPTLGRTTVNIIPYDGTPEKGKWNHMGILNKTDHEDIIGRSTSTQMGDLIGFYINYVEMLQGL
ncbi:MAG: lipase [Firmicutes bacterium HGW-Firmicutes-1]|jgi:triacylglycerol lipase|nr:MAG: lipase [Firmicutes bacterium HGW-Firmicutes-1]